MSRILLGWLGATGAALALIIAAEIGASGSADAPLQRGEAGLSSVQLGGRNVPASQADTEASRLAEILARPLFNRSRRPTEAAGSAAGPLRLAGVIVGPAGREAIFEPSGGGKPVIAKEGSTVGGATVRAISPGMVLIVDGTGAHILRPSFAPATAGTPSAAAGFVVPEAGPRHHPAAPK